MSDVSYVKVHFLQQMACPRFVAAKGTTLTLPDNDEVQQLEKDGVVRVVRPVQHNTTELDTAEEPDVTNKKKKRK